MVSRQTLLIVDDNESNIIALKETLEGNIDAEIFTATSGNEAVQKAFEQDFDLFMMDVKMPDMDGFEAVKYIKKEAKNKLIPVLFLTGVSAEPADIIKGLESGAAVDYIIKPIFQ